MLPFVVCLLLWTDTSTSWSLNATGCSQTASVVSCSDRSVLQIFCRDQNLVLPVSHPPQRFQLKYLTHCVTSGWADYRWYLGCSRSCCPSSCCCCGGCLPASESCCCCCSCMRCCRLRALLMQRCSRLWLLAPPSAATSCSLAAAVSHVNRKYTTERKGKKTKRGKNK